jgi:hypothetical protein
LIALIIDAHPGVPGPRLKSGGMTND